MNYASKFHKSLHLGNDYFALGGIDFPIPVGPKGAGVRVPIAGALEIGSTPYAYAHGHAFNPASPFDFTKIDNVRRKPSKETLEKQKEMQQMTSYWKRLLKKWDEMNDIDVDDPYEVVAPAEKKYKNENVKSGIVRSLKKGLPKYVKQSFGSLLKRSRKKKEALSIKKERKLKLRNRA